MISTLTPELKETITTMYLAGHGATTVGRAIGRSETFVKYNLMKLGYEIRKAGDYRKYKLNEHYFDTIDTHEKAYWLGFLYADGYNHEGRNEVKVCLNVKDWAHMEKFRDALESDLPIKQNACNIRDNSAQIVICNKGISEALAKHGCVQNKSFVIRIPNLDKVYMPSFLLGYFDGDGSVSGTKEKGAFSITASYDFVTDYQQVLIDNCAVTKTKPDTKRATAHKPLREKAWVVQYSGVDNLKAIYTYLYSTNIYSLPRNKTKFQELIGMDNPITT